jgi:hypothetical protein
MVNTHTVYWKQQHNDIMFTKIQFYMHFSSVHGGKTDFVCPGERNLNTVITQWFTEGKIFRVVFQDPTQLMNVFRGKRYRGCPLTHCRHRCQYLPALTVIASTNCSFQEDVPIKIDAFALWTSLSTVFWNREMYYVAETLVQTRQYFNKE